jgi:hypothetical protein
MQAIAVPVGAAFRRDLQHATLIERTQHRFVYQLPEKEKIVNVLRMWTHYE